MRPRLGTMLPLAGHLRLLRRNLTVHASVAWFDYLKHEADRASVMEYRFLNYASLTAEDLGKVGDRWLKNDPSTKFEMEFQESTFLVRPFWISIKVKDTGVSELYVSFIPVDETVESGFLSESEPQAVFGSDWLFTQCDHQSGRWRGYFVGLIGDIGRDWRDGLSPIIVFHNNRRAYEPRSFYQIGEFLADPTKGRIEQHYKNLKRLINGQARKNYFHSALEGRWGRDALLRHDIQL